MHLTRKLIGPASILCALSPFLHAQDGGQLYTLYCSACHGADGSGATGGAFPPLAGSPWLAGDPDRAIKIVLHGLEGPVQVLGKTYNLEMPPQGATLPDDQIAAILTFVRSSWGNQARPVAAEEVTKIRTATADRDAHWTAEELLKQHPLDGKPPLTDLISHVYSGKWKTVPDFSKLEPNASEEEHDGLISLRKTGKKRNFGVVWEGTLGIPTDGEFDFHLAADDGGRLWVDGKRLLEIPGIGSSGPRAEEATIRLSKGPHKVQVDYFETKGKKEIHVGWRKSGDKPWTWLTDETVNNGKSWPEILLAPTAEAAVIYRNFIAETSPRAIGVGFPGGINMAYSGDNLGPELIWTGKFIDAGRHWTDRGIGNQPPAGKNIVKLTGKPVFPANASAQGYILDSAGNPTFATSVGKLKVLDSYTSSPPATLVRVIKVSGTSGSTASMTLADGMPVATSSPDTYDLDGKISLIVKAAKRTGPRSLVLPLVPGTTTEIRYLWK
jgi:mono/diheme cytochrome c family protein